MTTVTTRNLPLEATCSAFLVVDVQHYCCAPQGDEFDGLSGEELRAYDYYFAQLKQVTLPNIRCLQDACRSAGIEVLFTVVECLTKDGRERGLDYKISGLFVPKGSPGAAVLPEIKPNGDEIVIPKSSSSVFNSTNIDYILRSLGCQQLVICGVLTDQCVESAVRDACDLNYLVTLVSDACATYSEARHHHSLAAIKGYCRQVSTAQLLEEIQNPTVKRERPQPNTD